MYYAVLVKTKKKIDCEQFLFFSLSTLYICIFQGVI